MNENNIEAVKKLKELRDKNVLTQEEFDKQIAVYLSSDNEEHFEKSRHNNILQKGGNFSFSKIVEFIWIILIAFGIIVYIMYPPNCNTNEVKKTLSDTLKESLFLNVPFSLNSLSEISYDKQTGTRKCQANVMINGQIENIIYNINDTDSLHYSVELDDSNDALYHKYKLLCDDKENVVQTLFEVIEEYFGAKPLSIEEYKDLSYDEKTLERQCFALVNFENDEKVALEYSISRTDSENFSVSLDEKYLTDNLITQCNILSEKYAEEIISTNYEIFKDLRLSSPEFVSKNEKEQQIVCKSNTNLKDFSVMYYELSKEDDEVYVTLKSPFKCNKASMMIAQAAIVSSYKDFENLELRNPEEVERNDDVLTCRVYTNFIKLHIMSYQISKEEGENVAQVYVNPVADVMDDTIGKIFRQQERYFDME